MCTSGGVTWSVDPQPTLQSTPQSTPSHPPPQQVEVYGAARESEIISQLRDAMVRDLQFRGPGESLTAAAALAPTPADRPE